MGELSKTAIRREVLFPIIENLSFYRDERFIEDGCRSRVGRDVQFPQSEIQASTAAPLPYPVGGPLVLHHDYMAWDVQSGFWGDQPDLTMGGIITRELVKQYAECLHFIQHRGGLFSLSLYDDRNTGCDPEYPCRIV